MSNTMTHDKLWRKFIIAGAFILAGAVLMAVAFIFASLVLLSPGG